MNLTAWWTSLTIPPVLLIGNGATLLIRTVACGGLVLLETPVRTSL